MDPIELTHKIAGLTREERILLLHRAKSLLERSADVGARQKRLVAYVRPKDSFVLEEYQKQARKRLPLYMVPSQFIVIDQIPLLPNGKVDRNALQKKTSKSIPERIRQKPRTKIEQLLVDIWEEVLQVGAIGVHDNFFEIGGDSILSIQIVSKARKVGLNLKPNQLFENQTIAQLALFVEVSNDESMVGTETPEVGVEIALTPIQHWFFESHVKAPHYWNQVYRISTKGSIARETMKSIAENLIDRHDALRLKFVKREGRWAAVTMATEELVPFRFFNLGNIEDIERQNVRIDEILVSEQGESHLEQGGLFRIYFFERGAQHAPEIQIVAHHLIVDAISWRTIFDFIAHNLNGMHTAASDSLPRNSATFAAWSQYLQRAGESNSFEDQVDYWRSQQRGDETLPLDYRPPDMVDESSVSIARFSLDIETTQLLLNKANVPYNTKVEDLLVTALMATLFDWAGFRSFCLWLERHGRDILGCPLELADTVGWLTSMFPLRLQYDPKDSMGNRIKSIKEQVRSVPDHGVGYGVLRYLARELDVALPQESPELLFNYLGIQDGVLGDTDVQVHYRPHISRASESEHPSRIEINTLIEKGQLHINWTYSELLHNKSTIEKLGHSLLKHIDQIVIHCREKEHRDFTPSDFPEAGLSQEDLDDLLNNL